jgi:hypothetical protein
MVIICLFPGLKEGVKPPVQEGKEQYLLRLDIQELE